MAIALLPTWVLHLKTSVRLTIGGTGYPLEKPGGHSWQGTTGACQVPETREPRFQHPQLDWTVGPPCTWLMPHFRCSFLQGEVHSACLFPEKRKQPGQLEEREKNLQLQTALLLLLVS